MFYHTFADLILFSYSLSTTQNRYSKKKSSMFHFVLMMLSFKQKPLCPLSGLCCNIETFNHTKLLLKSNNNIYFIDIKYVWKKEQCQLI